VDTYAYDLYEKRITFVKIYDIIEKSIEIKKPYTFRRLLVTS